MGGEMLDVLLELRAGGDCAESATCEAALKCLRTGETTLIDLNDLHPHDLARVRAGVALYKRPDEIDAQVSALDTAPRPFD
jgi:selenocysteine lyase/cysteine desulfurase